MRETIRSAAAKLTGYRRRQFQAEMAVKYCDSSPRLAERVFGWARDSVQTGLHERRSGIRCVERFHERGRKRTEDVAPAIAAAIRRLVEPQAQIDPTFESPLAFTRVTARAVRDELLKDPALAPHVPCRQTVGSILHRLDYRLRPVIKARPQKKLPRPTPFSTTSTLPGNEHGATRPACESRSTGRPKFPSGRSRVVAGHAGKRR
jgi:hypothetical protein